MKIVRLLFAIMICFIFASCASDEQKALSFVKTEVMPEKAIEKYLMKYNAKIVNDEFWKSLRTCLSEFSEPCGKNYYRIYLTYGWGNERGKNTYWTFNSSYGYLDSEKILQLINNKTKEYISLAIESDSIEYYASAEFGNGNKFFSCDDNTVREEVLNEAVYFNGFYSPVWKDMVKMLGLEDTRETRERYVFRWTSKSAKQQQDFVISLAEYIISYAVCMINSNDFKLIDAQGVKTGENTFKVTYLLEPKLKIVFDITKVGNSFTCDNIEVEGLINWNIKEEFDDGLL